MDFRRSLILSVFFHLALLLGGLISLPSLTPNMTSVVASIPVDLISDEDMMAGEKDGQKSETPQNRKIETPVVKPEPVPEKEKAKPVEQSSAPALPEPSETAPPEPQKKPADSKEKPAELNPEGLLKKIEQAKKEEEKKKAAEEKKKLADQKKKAEQERLQKQAEAFDASKISNLINRQDGSPAPTGEQGTPAKPALGATKGTGRKLTQSQFGMLIGMIQEQITPCWSPPMSATGTADLVVSIRISMNADGSLNGRPSVTNSSSNPAFRANADAATRAILRCSPLKLPADMYDVDNGWKELIFSFNPSKIF